MVAERGPIPARSDERRRTNAPADGLEISKAPGGGEVQWTDPPGDPENPKDPAAWHPLAENWYLGLQTSGQAVFFEQSDADTAYLMAENMSRLLKPQFVGMKDVWNREAQQMEHVPAFVRKHIVGADLNALIKGMGLLGSTEGDRRRMRIELQRAGGDAPAEETRGQAIVRQTKHMLGVVDGGA